MIFVVKWATASLGKGRNNALIVYKRSIQTWKCRRWRKLWLINLRLLWRTEGLTTSVLYIREKSYQRSIKNTTDSKKLRWWNFSAFSLTIILLYQKFWGKSNFEVRKILDKIWPQQLISYLLAAFAAARSVSEASRAKSAAFISLIATLSFILLYSFWYYKFLFWY